MKTPSFEVNGKTFLVIERAEYDRLRELAKAAVLPPLPEPDSQGNYPAVQFARATIARNIIRDRVKAGLSQKKLAALAGVRVETLCRIETGKHTPSIETIQSIDRALKNAAKHGRQTAGTRPAHRVRAPFRA